MPKMVLGDCNTSSLIHKHDKATEANTFFQSLQLSNSCKKIKKGYNLGVLTRVLVFFLFYFHMIFSSLCLLLLLVLQLSWDTVVWLIIKLLIWRAALVLNNQGKIITVQLSAKTSLNLEKTGFHPNLGLRLNAKVFFEHLDAASPFPKRLTSDYN